MHFIELAIALVGALILHALIMAFGFDTIAAMVRDRKRASAIFAVAGFAILGALLGYSSTALVSHSVSPIPEFRVFNMAVTPSICGTMMHFIGRSRQQRGFETTYFASFRGGAAFAFGILLARFLILPSRL